MSWQTIFLDNSVKEIMLFSLDVEGSELEVRCACVRLRSPARVPDCLVSAVR
jgi:hypothetical protein